MLDQWIDQLYKGQALQEDEILKLSEMVKTVLTEEGNVLNINHPIIIFGDIHGQFYDMIEVFNTVGRKIPSEKYLFLGDYVDRGLHSLETIELLLALKLRYPDRIYLLRGSHESRTISTIYGFYHECIRKHGTSNVWSRLMEVFDLFSIAAVISNKIFCVHGGLIPDIKLVNQINEIERKKEITEGVFADLLFSEPADIEDWEINPRGSGWLFGSRVASEFNHVNGLSLICSGMTYLQEGYKYWFEEKSVLSIFSPPNYLNMCGNFGAILKVDENCQESVICYKEPANIRK